MSTVYRWIKCATPGCDSKHSGFYALDFDFLANLPEGWTTDPARCPECNNPETDGPGDDRMLVVPLPCGAFTAYAPVSMTPEDWRVVQGICGAMAGGHGDAAVVTKDDVIHRLRSIDGMSASNASNYIKRGGLVDAGNGMFTASSVDALINRIQPKMARRNRAQMAGNVPCCDGVPE